MDQQIRGKGRRAIIRLISSDKTPLVFKIRTDLSYATLLTGLRAQTAFANALADHPMARAPAVHGSIRRLRTIVMDYVAGKEALRVAQKDRDCLPAVLANCAKWRDACWQAFHVESVKWSAAPARYRLDWARRKAPWLSDDPEFAALESWCRQQLDKLEGRDLQVGQSHGDLHLKNIILGDDGLIWGLDYEVWEKWPITYDLARLLSHTATMFGPQDAALMNQAEMAYRRSLLSEIPSPDAVDHETLDLFLAIDTLVYRGDTSAKKELTTRRSRARHARTQALLGAMLIRHNLSAI